MSIAKVTELIASSPKGFDDAIHQGVVRARKTLRNLQSAWVENEQIRLDEKGNVIEYRVQLKVTFILDD
jgi:flavin-binding protein dodecin